MFSAEASEVPSSTPSTAEPVTILETRVVTGTGGGPEKTILNSPRFLDPHGYRTICAYMHPPDDPGFETLQRRADSLGVRMISLPDRGTWDWSVVRRLQRICREERVTVWHGHDYKSNLLGVWVRRSFPLKLLSTAHGWVERYWKAPIHYALDRWALRFYDRVVCVSPDLLEACLRSGISADRLTLIENGIDVDRFQRTQTPAAARRYRGKPPEEIWIGAIGRLSREKGFDLLIQAVHRLRNEFPELRLVIAGEGAERPALEQLISSLDLSSVATLPGYCEDVPGLLEMCDLFALSSLREGLPNVVLEAMAMEVPVVATRIAGVPKLITDRMDGVLIEPNSVEALVAGLRRCLADPSERRRLALAGRETVATKYSFALRMDRMRQVYDELLNRV